MSTTTGVGCPVLHGGDYHGYQPFQQKDPFPAYARLREEAPVMFDDRIGYWIVSRYDDIKAVFADWETFSSENAQASVRPWGAQATKIMTDGGFTAYSGLSARIPPEHTRIRAIAQKAFTPRRYRALEPQIRENFRTLLAGMLERGPGDADILRDIAYTLPTVTILTLIGEDLAKLDDYKRWSDSRAAMTWSDLSDAEQIPHARNLVEYWQSCLALVDRAHREGGDNMVADIVAMQEAGEQISDHEIASLCYSLLFAGHETTTTLISNTFRLLLDDPQQWQLLLDDRKKIPGAIEEVLRYSGSIVAWRRKATRDTEVGGVPIKQGDGLVLLMGSANRDEEHFENPETFDITRANAREHLSFGFGIHYCLGNMLAKLQTKIAVEEIAELAPFLRVSDGEAIEFRKNLSFRVPTSVNVQWQEEQRA